MSIQVNQLSSFEIVKRRRRGNSSAKKAGNAGKPITKLSSFDTVKNRHSGNAEIFTIGQDLDIIVDRSASMQSMDDAPATQIRNLLIDQQKIANESGKSIRITLTTFDDSAETILDNIDIGTYDIPEIGWFKDVLKPRGCTRFYDTLIECMANQKSRVNNWYINPSVRKLKPIIGRTCYVLTDGQDNRSGLSITNLRSAMTTNKLQTGFNAIFLAANLGNAQEVGASMGFDPNTSLTIDSGRHGSSNGMKAAASLLRAISSGSSAPPAFTALQRQSSAPVPNYAYSPSHSPSPPSSPINVPMVAPPLLFRC